MSTIFFKKLCNKLLTFVFWICVGITTWILLSIFCVASFKIPTDSMEPTLLPGDFVLVNKLDKGARLFNLRAALEGENFNIYRMPAFSSFERNDVLVFNYPYPVSKKAIGFDLMKYYVKRCIALPGDTLEIRDGYFHIRGTEVNWRNKKYQEHLSAMLRMDSTGIKLRSYPQNKEMGWTIREFGPFPIPQTGQTIDLTAETFSLYHRAITWEQQKELRMTDERFYLGDSLVTRYRFTKNYYFMSGDKLQNSNDSRYWGLVPEEFIVGKASLIWKSNDPHTGKTRWDRVFKKIQ